jgi:carboxylesterase type B
MPTLKNSDVCLGPVIDNLYVPDLPGVLLYKGNYNKSVKIIAAYNSNEGAVFNPVSYASTVLRLKHQANICRTSPVTIFSTSMPKIYFRMQVRQS